MSARLVLPQGHGFRKTTGILKPIFMQFLKHDHVWLIFWWLYVYYSPVSFALFSLLNFPSLRNVNSCREGRVLRCWIITGFKILLAGAILRDICLQWVIKLWRTFLHFSKTRCDFIPVIVEEYLQVLSSMQMYHIIKHCEKLLFINT